MQVFLDARDCMVVRWGILVMITNFTKKNVKIKTTVRHRGIGTGISEASKRAYFSLCYPGRQASEFLFLTEELGPSPRGSDPVPCRLT